MLFSLLYVLFRRILGTGGGPDLERDVEVLVLRHQLRVLRRKVRRPRLRRLDRVFLAAASRALPRTLLPSFIVRPETLLRAAPVAPRTGEEEMDVQEEGPPREAGTRCRDQRPHPAHGPGEPPVGVSADPRRTAEARGEGVGHDDPDDSAPPRSGPSSPVGRAPPGPSSCASRPRGSWHSIS